VLPVFPRIGRAWQGTWTLVASTYDGEPQMADMQWVVECDQYRIDAIHHEAPKGTYGGKLKGIYKINANSLTGCYDLTATRYPKSFEAKRGSRRVLYQFRREGP
jgi:hypothetical protein